MVIVAAYAYAYVHICVKISENKKNKFGKIKDRKSIHVQCVHRTIDS